MFNEDAMNSEYDCLTKQITGSGADLTLLHTKREDKKAVIEYIRGECNPPVKYRITLEQVE